MRNGFLTALVASAATLTMAVVLATPALAQETTSTIRGTVTSGGNPLAGATVDILDTSTGAKASVKTTSTGAFSVSGLRAGDTYTVNVNAAGHSSASVTDIVTVVTQAYELPIELDSGDGAAEIVVTATRLKGAGSISQGPATVLGAEQIANVVSTNRDIRDLSRRDPFARLDDTPGGGRAISFAGQNPRYNRFTVDGVGISDSFGLNPDGLPSRRSPVPFDAIGQFQAKVAPFDIRDGNFQGGAINIVLRSGKNDFQGTGFFAYSADELNGKETKAGPGIPTGVVTLPNYTYKNFGAQISGPIIKDTLFFMVAAERLRAARPLAQGPGDNNAGAAIPTLTQAQVDSISQIAKSVYNYDTGGVAKSNEDADDRLVARLDWNVSSSHRAALTYMYAKDSFVLNTPNTNTSTATPGLSLASNSYIQGNRLHTGVLQVNSDWSDTFSTEARGFYKNYVRIQDPLLGRGFAEFGVCTAPTSDRTNVGAAATANINCPSTNAIVSFGPDVSRQTNALNVKAWGGMLQGQLKMGDHTLKAFVEFQDVKTFNSFVPRSSGQYYFDSIADFQAGTAQRLRYQTNPVSFNANDAAASFQYQSYVFGIQDSWRVNDTLNVDVGLRYDLYGGASRPVLNTIFASRYGFDNTKFVNGLAVLQPRFGFTYKPIREVSFRGGIGVFAGGTPDVYVSNSFSNTGVLTNAIDIQQLNNGTYNNASGAAILSNVNGATIPAAANSVLGAVALSPTAPVNALAKNFKLPRQLRATLSADWEPESLGGLGSGWSFGADVLYSKVLQQVFFTDLRVQANGTLTPDGRARYTPLTTFGDTNSDIVLANSTEGRGIFFVLRARKSFDFGLDTQISYTHANINDRNPATSSVAASNYAAGVALDANGPAFGTSNDQVDNAVKFNVSFTHEFFGDNKTSIALFGESRSGHPYSFTFRDLAARSAVFGTIGAGSRYLLYVPTGVNDPKVSFDNANNAALFDDYVNRSGLSKFRGLIAPRNAFRSNRVTKIDLSFSQEVPIAGRAKLKLFADIENFTNLLNKNWGQVREYAFPYAVAPVQVSCLTAPVATGTAPGASAAANAGQACAQYRYAPNQTAVVGGVTQFTDPSDEIYPNQSLYTIRIGARISF
jgi:hypothetical protein